MTKQQTHATPAQIVELRQQALRDVAQKHELIRIATWALGESKSIAGIDCEMPPGPQDACQARALQQISQILQRIPLRESAGDHTALPFGSAASPSHAEPSDDRVGATHSVTVRWIALNGLLKTYGATRRAPTDEDVAQLRQVGAVLDAASKLKLPFADLDDHQLRAMRDAGWSAYVKVSHALGSFSLGETQSPTSEDQSFDRDWCDDQIRAESVGVVPVDRSNLEGMLNAAWRIYANAATALNHDPYMRPNVRPLQGDAARLASLRDLQAAITELGPCV